MRNCIGFGMLAGALCFASAANAENFTYEVTWGDVDTVGGVGPNGTAAGGGTVSGTYVTTVGGETINGAISCVGMRESPSSSVFDLRLACDATRDGGATTAIVYGCSYLGEPGPGTALGCVGAIRASDGENEGAMGSVTMHWHAANAATGTGQWYD
jgi:hypothetical protein